MKILGVKTLIGCLTIGCNVSGSDGFTAPKFAEGFARGCSIYLELIGTHSGI